MSQQRVFITECPRDAMQGLHDFIPTEVKIEYLNRLLEVGFDRLDFGSFVSPKAIPQLRDTAQVLEHLDTGGTTELIAIIANQRGATNATAFKAIKYLGYPFSVSETFQLRNTNNTISGSYATVNDILEISGKHDKEVIVYISMAFGNPYGDPWNPGVVIENIGKLTDSGVQKIALADTVGLASPDDVYSITRAVLEAFPGVETGIHLHCRPDGWHSKVDAAYRAGCRRFDAAIKGFGGCPMAGDELTGNLATENLVQYILDRGAQTAIDPVKFQQALTASSGVFMEYH